MTPESSAAAVTLPPALHVGPPAADGLFARDGSRVQAAEGAVTVARDGLEHGFRRVFSALGDIVGLAAVAYAFPLVILAVGSPVALLVRLVMWMVGRG